MLTLAIIIPCYNEAATLSELLNRVTNAATATVTQHLIIVDDGSQDQSVQIAQEYAATQPNIQVIQHPYNQGKGAALRTGFAAALAQQHDFILVQDGDLEYDPADYPRLLAPLLQARADVVFGSRFVGGESHRVLYFWHSVGNKCLTLLSNMLTNLNLTDMEVGYKVFRREVLAQLDLQENRFGIEPEITAKLSRLRPQIRVYEVGISYAGRTYAEGKKITWKDGLWAICCIIRYRFF